MDDKEPLQAKTKSCIYNMSTKHDLNNMITKYDLNNMNTKHDLNLQKCEEAMLCVVLGNFLFFMITIGFDFSQHLRELI
jgi:hypothetical protein